MPALQHHVERALTAREDVADALVLDYGSGAPILVLVQPDGVCSGPDVRDECASLLDDHANRVVVVLMPEIPAGGADLPDPRELLAKSAHVYAYQAATSATELSLVAMWNDILNRPRTGVLDDFLDLGGDSLKLTLLINRIFDEFGVTVEIGDFIEDPTIRALAALVDAASS